MSSLFLFAASDYPVSVHLLPELGPRFHVRRDPCRCRTWPRNRLGPSLLDVPIECRPSCKRTLAELVGTRRRERTCPSRYRYVRRVKGGWQARIPVGPTPADSINLGWFSDIAYESREAAEVAAGRAATWFSRLRVAGKTCWQVVCELQARGYVPAGVLPRWVYRRADGLYAARRVSRKKGRGFDLPGPYTSPVEAFAAAAAALGRKVVA